MYFLTETIYFSLESVVFMIDAGSFFFFFNNSDLKDLPGNSNICVTAVFTTVNYMSPGNWYFPQSSCAREFWVVFHTSWLLYYETLGLV